LPAYQEKRQSTDLDMRIGIDIRSAIHEPAGIGTLTLNLVRQLMREDRQNEYFLYGDAPFDFGISNDRFHAVTKSSGVPVVGKLVWHLSAAFDARYRLRLDRFVSVGSLQVSALTRDFTVLVVPDLSHILLPEYHIAKSRVTARLVMKQALLRARRIVAISEHTKADILAHMKGRIEERKISVAHLACDETFSRTPTAEDIQRVRERYLLPEKYVLAVGTLEPRKNYETLIRAFRKCMDEGVTHNLVIVGRKGWFFETIFREVKTLGLESNVRFLGFVPSDDLPSIYARADAFVYPSLYEGFGIPPLEAMTCGVPVITSNTTSLPEVTGNAAILVNPRDPQELSVQLSTLLRDEQLRNFYRRAGIERARQFSWKSFADKILEALQG